MKAFFKDIFEYHHYFNQKLGQQMIENKNILSEKVIPLFSHTINAHQIWNARITNTEKLDVHQVHSLPQCIKIDINNFKDTLEIINEYKLNEIIPYSNSKGNEFNNSIEQILFHIANHFSHHKGQIISDLKHSGITPLITDYIFYKR
ncbi:MAG: DinB family protein [Vicingaceae bacterium]|jgi:uncharacterized damage-inducible protein DinB|nr:damage-inducible protein DinB [Flavobacteriales bacterium]MBQ20968.1 damage-inducible protein DinB [Flavobacteriales bacterium]MDF1675626.1 DinB family protein [Vicingaceae bacterium]|tara:strand:- start:89671 stop:90111 length:441 start_codon:yes stop_codon:yes gene_type:complete